jgi:hypothetical protein
MSINSCNCVVIDESFAVIGRDLSSTIEALRGENFRRPTGLPD